MGIIYMTWRIMRGFTNKTGWLDWVMLGKNYYNPDDPEQGWNFKVELQEHWWAWVILFTEALLMMGVWLTHVTRIFPVKRYGAHAHTGPRHIMQSQVECRHIDIHFTPGGTIG
jgi:hypothetical protein